MKTLIYSQPNWPEELQQLLAVEVPELKGRLALPHHKELLRDRYRKLAQKALEEGQRPEEWVEDLLEVSPPAEDSQEIADSILNSEAFHNLMLSRDELPAQNSLSNNLPPTSITDQKTLRQLYEGTNLEQIARLLREHYLNSLEA